MTTMSHMTLRLRRLLGLALLSVLVGAVLPVLAPSTARAADGDAGTDYGRMMLVLDSSGSMKEPAGDGQSKIEAAKSALGDVVGNLPEDADVGLRVFGAKVFSRQDKGACQDSQQVVRPGTDNRDALTKAIASYKPYGETPIAYALQQAADDIGAEGSRSIVLVSDGIATCQPDPCDVASKIADRGIDLKVDVVGLGVSGRARSQLRCIAANGNGRYYDADSADEIADSLTTVADRAVRPFELDGKAIAGGDDLDTATPITAGTWTDVIGPLDSETDERWYRYDRTIKGSTLLVGATAVGNLSVDSFALDVLTEDGDSCNSDANGSTGVRFELFGIGTQVGTGADLEKDDPCLTGPLFIKLDRSNDTGREKPSRYSLRIAEEPPVEDTGGLPAAVDYDEPTFQEPQGSGIGAEVQGGQSLGDATELKNGRYQGRIVPGEMQVFKMKVGWGQRLAAKVTPEKATPELEKLGLADTSAQVQIMNPMGAETPDDLEGSSVIGGDLARVGDDFRDKTIGTVPVNWRNREGITQSYLDGYYYLVYSAEKNDQGASAELPFTLDVEVQGEETGAPTYAAGASLVTDSEQAQVEDDQTTDAKDKDGRSSRKSASGGADAADDGGVISTPIKLVAAGGLGLVALACVAAAVLLVLRRPAR